MSNNIELITEEYQATRRALKRLMLAEESVEVKDSWRNFLGCFGIVIEKLVSSAKSSPSTNSFGCRLGRASMYDDEGLLYLREARNVAHHGIELPAAQVGQATFIFGGNALAVGEGCNPTIGRLFVNGVDHGGLKITQDKDCVTQIDADPRLALETQKAKILLLRAFNKEKKPSKMQLSSGDTNDHLVVEPPKSVFGRDLSKGDAIELAEIAMQGLAEKIDEYRQLET